MKKKSTTSIIILAVMGLIFGSDAVLLSLGYPTYSQNISDWLQGSVYNLIIFIAGVVLLSVHWIFGRYK